MCLAALRRPVAPGEDAPAVPNLQGGTDRAGDEPLRPSDIEGERGAAQHYREHVGVARQTPEFVGG